jgi:glutamyl-tRNA reductase
VAKAGYRVGFRSNSSRGIHGLAAARLLKMLGENARRAKIAVAGMGSIGRKTAAMINQTIGCETVLFNRTIDETHAAAWKSISRLREESVYFDALVLATGSRSPIFGADSIDFEGRGKRLIIIDLGIPRQAAPGLRTREEVDYVEIDDLLETNADPETLRRSAKMEEKIESELARFKRFCMERGMVSLLETAHTQRRDFIRNLIPSLVESDLPELDEQTKRRVEAVMQRLVRDYSNNIFASIHGALEEYRSVK